MIVRKSRFSALSFVCWAVLATTFAGFAASPVQAGDEPDLIFRRSTVFKLLSPDDKLATYGLDDPDIEGVACHFTVPEKGGYKELAWACRAGLGYLAVLPADRAHPLQGKAGTRRRHVSPATLAVFQEDADRARM